MIQKKDVLWLAGLAKLKLSEEELEQLTVDMEDIVAFAGEVAKAAAGTEAYRGTIADAETLREDAVGVSSPQEDVLSNVDGGENGYFPVKRRKHDAR